MIAEFTQIAPKEALKPQAENFKKSSLLTQGCFGQPTIIFQFLMQDMQTLEQLAAPAERSKLTADRSETKQSANTLSH